jgi:hypothetical protein
MPVQGRQERRRPYQQLALFEARIPLPRWSDLEPATRTEVVATLAAVLIEHIGQDRDTSEAHDE